MTSVLDEVRLPRSLAQANEKLRREIAAHEATRRELEAVRRELESRVAERTRELSQVKQRFETALRGAKVYVFSQDSDLRYTWVYSSRGEAAAAKMLGRTDDEILASTDHKALIACKRQVLESGQPGDCEVSYIFPERRALFALHVDPTFGPDGRVGGIMCAAIDISHIRSLESEQRRLAEELGTTVQRYETALRGSNVAVYTQDLDLRYTAVSKPLFGIAVDDILGRSDEDVLPAESRAPIVALKRQVLEDGISKNGEFGIDKRWYDFHIEPLRDVTGAIVGLTCAAVDITERKKSEEHLRLVMRELTHRSKNLLAVIQAMARQTARHTAGADGFLDRFAGRLQALACSHDLLVQQSWHGASLDELVRAQLAHYIERGNSQVTLEGPDVVLKPEAAQSLGLAFHELTTNAAKYGSLVEPKGRVAIQWRALPPSAGGGIEILWTESEGPKVAGAKNRGFGSMAVEQNLRRALDAEVELQFPAKGLRCRIVLPAGQLAASG
jgi:PAS domain S-box-containing protein